MELYNWSDVPEEKVTPLATRQIIGGVALKIIRRRLLKGWQGKLHRHPDEQITMIESGKLLFLVDGKEQTAEAGHVLVIPPNVLHSIAALEDTLMTDLFSGAPCSHSCTGCTRPTVILRVKFEALKSPRRGEGFFSSPKLTEP